MTVDAVGGVWQYAKDLSAALRPLGYETILAVIGPAPNETQNIASGGAKVIVTGLALDWLANHSGEVAKTSAALFSLARDERVDLVHLNQPAIAASAGFDVPVIAAIHSCVATWWNTLQGTELPPSLQWQSELVHKGLRIADAVVAPSRAFADAVRAAYDLDFTPECVLNGRRALARVDNAIGNFVFTAGRLWDRGKNVGLLDRVAARTRAPMRAAGPLTGPNGEHIVLKHVEALGALSETAIARHLEARPVFVSAALYEPFGLAVLEAAQAGCALVLADIPTFRELWDGVALFVEPHDEDGFVEALNAASHDTAMRVALGAAARNRAVAFTPQRMAQGVAGTYERCLDRDARKRDAAA